MDQNPYAPPEATSATPDTPASHLHLASRWARLGAAIVDIVILMVIMIPVLSLTGGLSFPSNTNSPGTTNIYDIGMALLGNVIYIMINYNLLTSHGQTIGKKLLNIRIVALDGRHADLKEHLIPRFAFDLLLPMIPSVGELLALIDVLFIFRADKRCLHDLFGKTKVVKA